MNDCKVKLVRFSVDRKPFNVHEKTIRKHGTGKDKSIIYNEAFVLANVCIDDWEEIWIPKELNLYVQGDTPEQAENNIKEYLDKETLGFEILYTRISMFKH